MAGEALRRLRHTGTVREYVKHFASLMLDVKNMSDEDKLLNFTSGFQNWAKVELRRQGARDVQSAMAMADALVDYRSSDHGDGGDNGKGETAGGGVVRWVTTAETTMNGSPMRGCYDCAGPHRARDCVPRADKAALSAMVQTAPTSETPTLNLLQLLGALQQQQKPSNSDERRLLYLDATINGNPVKFMVDSGATHCFISAEEASRLGLTLSREDSHIKAVNSEDVP
ncbi:unnamed protein product [Spirodela intermedia]|uniref:Uncharacterized protein n=1 Tax=Spirodela intermedia TaxID=51605 RepID=A0A7I8IC18_SPIIN|nr:unnamed protein product [Spirodela intermedia]CAA6654602.1 unnamed protein product [Spirodela intermedia]